MKRELKAKTKRRYTDKNGNGVLDSHEKWWLIVRGVTFIWSLCFLTASYFGAKDVDRALVSITFTSVVTSFIVKKSK